MLAKQSASRVEGNLAARRVASRRTARTARRLALQSPIGCIGRAAVSGAFVSGWGAALVTAGILTGRWAGVRMHFRSRGRRPTLSIAGASAEHAQPAAVVLHCACRAHRSEHQNEREVDGMDGMDGQRNAGPTTRGKSPGGG